MKQILLSQLFVIASGVLLVQVVQPIASLGDEDQAWEQFPDGSVGRTTEFRGTNETLIAAFVRKPKGQGPFPAVVMIHGGGQSKQGTYALGRMTGAPTANFIAEGWAVYSIDFRPKSAFDPIEWEDTVRAVEAVRQLPFIDDQQVAMIGGSHGGLVTSRVTSRCVLSCAVACAPAAIDLIEVAKARQEGFRIIPKLAALIRRMEQEYGAPLAKIMEDPGAFDHQSALTEVEKVRCPLLLISGRNDTSSPPSVMEAYARKLRAAGKQVELYLPDNGPHGFYFGRPRIPETDEATRRAVGFMRKHFGLPTGATAPASVLPEMAPNRQSPAEEERPDRDRIEQVFRRLDRNEDGEIAGDEAVSEPGRRFLQMFDANEDSVVTREEIRSRMGTDGPLMRRRQATSQEQPRSRAPMRQLLREGRIHWYDARKDKAEDMLLKTFNSQAVGQEVSYLVYLPPQYERQKQRRFPVVYWLHGGGGTQRDCWRFLEQVKPAMRDGLCPPMIVIGVNGIAGSLYSDSKDGELPFESVIIKDLIPHIDATYRTVPHRRGRALEGFSMGGFGSLHLGLKYPEMFGTLTALGPALLEFDSGAGNVERALQSGPYEGDPDYFNVNDPFYLAEKNAQAIRGRTFIRLLDNERPDTFTHRRTLEFVSLLDRLNIVHEYSRLEGTGHSYAKYYDAKPDAYEFYTRSFAALGTTPTAEQTSAVDYPLPPVCYDPTDIHRERARDARPVEPFEIMGGLYYVGNDHVSSHLLTSDDGLILIDTTMPHEVPWLLESIRKLGFHPRDVRVVIGTHWHVDHCGGHWYFQRHFGSQTWLHELDAPLVLSGAKWTEGHKIELDGTVQTLSSAFPPFRTDRLLKDREVAEWGGRVFTFHQVPDHTPGTLAIEFPLRNEDDQELKAILLGGLKPGSKVFANSCKRLKNIDAQVWLGSHPFQNDTLAKRERLLAGRKPNPFIDPGGWQGYLDRMVNLGAGEAQDRPSEGDVNQAPVRSTTRRAATSERSDDGEIDWDRARRLIQRMRNGEGLTDEERAFIERVREVRQNSRPGQAQRTQRRERSPESSSPANPLRRLSLAWVDPDSTSPPHTQLVTFDSETVQGPVSYLVYLPPAYASEPQRRYPVLYWLHGSGGTQRTGGDFVQRLDPAVRSGRAPEMIVVLVNGLRGATMYCDTKDGKWPLERVIINDLIPHVDGTYRTIPTRAGRAVEGFSMGGFGAGHLGFKYPGLFKGVSMLAPALLGPDLEAEMPKGKWQELLDFAFSGDVKQFRQNDPFALVEKNAGTIREQTAIRLVAHDESGEWLIPRCRAFHEVLDHHNVAHTFIVRSDIKVHNYRVLYDRMGDEALAFFATAFGGQDASKPAQNGAARAPMAEDELHDIVDIQMTVDAQSLRRLPSQWQDYFGKHYASSPEHAGIAWTTVRSYGGPHTGISAATGKAPPRKGPFTGKAVRIGLHDFRAPRRAGAKTAEQLIPELIRHRITAIYLMTNIVRPSTDKAFDKDLAYWALRQIYEAYPEAHRYVFFEIGNEVVSGHFDPKGLKGQPGFQPGPAPDGKFFGYDLEWKLDFYINGYLAPSIEVIRQVSKDVYGDASRIKILLGSVNPYNQQNIWFLKTLMNSRFDGMHAPTLKDEPVWKHLHMISVHYMGGSDSNFETMQEFHDLYVNTGKVEGIWNTEDHGGRGGRGPVTIVDRGLRHLAWAAQNSLNAEQTRIVWYGDNAPKPGGRAREAIHLLGDFLHGRPLYLSRSKLTGSNVYLVADGIDETLSRILVAIVPDRSGSLDTGNVRLRLPKQCPVSDWYGRAVQYSASAPAGETVPGVSRNEDVLTVHLSRSVTEPLLLFLAGDRTSEWSQ